MVSQRCNWPRATLACAALLLASAATARDVHAYVLPAEFLSRLVADGRRPSLRDATMTLSVERADSSAKSEARWSFKRPDRLRETWLDGPEERIEILRGGQMFTGDANAQSPNGQSRNLLPLLLFPGGKDLDESSALVLAGIAQAGINPNQVALARWRQGFAYVIGGEAWEVEKPQLWIDKATFAPVRLLYPTGHGLPTAPAATDPNATVAPAGAAPLLEAPEPAPAAVHEWRLGSYAGGLPRLIEEWHDGQRLYRAEVVHVLVNQRLDEGMFEPGWRPPPPPPPAMRPVRHRRGR